MLSTLHFGKFLPFTKVSDCSEKFAGERRQKLLEEPSEKFTNITETHNDTSHSRDSRMAEISPVPKDIVVGAVLMVVVVVAGVAILVVVLELHVSLDGVRVLSGRGYGVCMVVSVCMCMCVGVYMGLLCMCVCVCHTLCCIPLLRNNPLPSVTDILFSNPCVWTFLFKFITSVSTCFLLLLCHPCLLSFKTG